MKTYNANIEDAIKQHLIDHEFFFSFDTTKGVFMFPLGISGKVSTLVYHIVLNEHGFTTISHFPLAPSPSDQEMMNSMMHFLSLANFALPNASFEIDPNDGEINVKFYCCCRGLDAPTDGMIAERSPACYLKSTRKESFRSSLDIVPQRRLLNSVRVTMFFYRKLNPNDAAQPSLWVLFSAERMPTMVRSLKT